MFDQNKNAQCLLALNCVTRLVKIVNNMPHVLCPISESYFEQSLCGKAGVQVVSFAAVFREEHCVTSPKTAAKATRVQFSFVKFGFCSCLTKNLAPSNWLSSPEGGGRDSQKKLVGVRGPLQTQTYIPNSRQEYKNHTLSKTNMAKLNALFYDQKDWKIRPFVNRYVAQIREYPLPGLSGSI